MRNPHTIDAELRRRNLDGVFGSLGALRYQGTDGIDVPLEIPADFATTPYHLVVDDVTGLPSWVEDTGGGASALADLTDINLTGLADKFLLVWDAGSSKWIVRLLVATDISDLDTDATLAANSDLKIASQKALKSYIDNSLAGRAWKNYVRAATTAAGTLASSFENGDTVDGVVLATGDRILIKNQAAGAENGIYVVAASGAPTRATDADSSAELVNAAVFVSEGTANADTQWVCTTNAPITVGSTTVTFVQFGAGTTYSADESTLHLTGTTFSVKNAGITGTQIASSVALPGDPTTTTQSATDNSTKVATTAQVQSAIAKQPEVLIIAIGDETTALVTGTAFVTFRMPFAMTLTAVRASLTASSSSGNPTFDINESGTTILSTKLSVDSGEKTSTTAATPAVISDASLADDAEITIDIDVAGTGAAGAKIYLIGTRT